MIWDLRRPSLRRITTLPVDITAFEREATRILRELRSELGLDVRDEAHRWGNDWTHQLYCLEPGLQVPCMWRGDYLSEGVA